MKWKFCSPDKIPDDFIDNWQDMNRRFMGDHPALDWPFILSALQQFGTGDELLAQCRSNGEWIAAIVVAPNSYGIWTTFVPGQCCLTPFSVSPDADVSELFRSLMHSLPGMCWLLRMPKMDPKFQRVDDIQSGCPVDVGVLGRTFAICLSGDFADYWASRSKNLRRNLRKAFKNIADESLSIEFRLITDATAVPEAVEFHGSLEKSGWKGDAGTAIAADNHQGDFYVDLLTKFALTGQTLIGQLRLSGEPAASVLCISNNQMLIVLKTGYQLRFSPMVPGRVLDYLLLEECFVSDNLDIVEMYTRASKSDLSWATESRKMIDVNIYRSQWLSSAAKWRASLLARIRG